MDFFYSHFSLAGLDEAGSFHGIASDGSLNRNGWRYGPSAFSESLADHKRRGTMPACLIFHDQNRPVGKWTEIAQDADGLRVSGKIARETKDGAEAYALMSSGALPALSTGAVHLEVKNVLEGGNRIQLVTKADLVEVSLVSVPANPNAKIIRVNSLSGPADIEDLLRQTGISGRQAKAAASAAWRTLSGSPSPSDAALKEILQTASARLARFKKG